jgi:CRISPR type III-B/RAMP module-associated protein Cmr5
MNERNLESVFAEYARRCIADEQSIADEKQRCSYKSEARSLAAKIHGSGLMQTLAFYCSKMENRTGTETQYVKLCLHVMKALPLDGDLRSILAWEEGSAYVKELFENMVNNSNPEMMFLTERALKLASWLSRFAEISLGE